MIRLRALYRLLPALLLALASLPAAPACATPSAGHASPMTMAMTMPMPMPMPSDRRTPPPADHHVGALCIGCVAPATWQAPAIARPLPLAATIESRPLAKFAPRAAAPPDTPPPRLG